MTPTSLSSFQTSLDALLRTHLSASLKKRDKAKERRAEKLRKEQQQRQANHAAVAAPSAGGSGAGAGKESGKLTALSKIGKSELSICHDYFAGNPFCMRSAPHFATSRP